MPTPTPTEPDATELATAANEVVRAIDSLRKEIASAQKYGRRNRVLIWAVALSVVLDLLLSVALIGMFQRTSNAVKLANRASSAQMISCHAGNEARGLQTQLWETILAFPPSIGETAAAAKEREERTSKFRAYIKDAFAQQDCEKQARGKS